MTLPVSWILFASIALLLLSVYLFVLERRWLARFRRGFLITLMLALSGIGVGASLLVGIWGYDSAERVLSGQTVQTLGNIGRIIEGEIGVALDQAVVQMEGLAGTVAGNLAADSGPKSLPSFEELEHINARFLQLDLIDSKGNTRLSIGRQRKTEPVNRVASAFGFEGQRFTSDPYYSPAFDRFVLFIGIPVKSVSGAVIGFIATRFDIEDTLTRIVTSTRFGETGYAAVVSSDGRVMAHPDPKRAHESLIRYLAVQAGLRGERGSVAQTNRQGRQMLYFYRPLAGPGTVNPKPMVLLTEISQAEATEGLRNLRTQFAVGTAVFGVICLIVAWCIVHSLRKPVYSLLSEVRRIEAGDLVSRIENPGHDEFGQLETSLNEMARGLEEKERVKELFGRYVTTQVSEQVLKGKVSLGGESRRVTMLFSDIRNFTTMAERMTPTQVVAFLNDYFSEMVEAVFENGGVLDKFIGDGMMAVFGSFDERDDHPRRAVMAALRMKSLLGKINGDRTMKGLDPISIGIGVHTDEVIVGNIGSRKRLEYTVIGDGVNTSSRVESLNKQFGTTILVSSSTYECVKDIFQFRSMPETPLKGKTKTLALYEVLSIRPEGQSPAAPPVGPD
jgi:class 3 adenylate cyclase